MEAILTEMKESGVEPNKWTQNILLECYAWNKKATKAQALMPVVVENKVNLVQHLGGALRRLGQYRSRQYGPDFTRQVNELSLALSGTDTAIRLFTEARKDHLLALAFNATLHRGQIPTLYPSRRIIMNSQSSATIQNVVDHFFQAGTLSQQKILAKCLISNLIDRKQYHQSILVFFGLLDRFSNAPVVMATFFKQHFMHQKYELILRQFTRIALTGRKIPQFVMHYVRKSCVLLPPTTQNLQVIRRVYQIHPTIETFNKLLEILISTKQFTKAFNFFENGQNVPLNLDSYYIFLSMFLRKDSLNALFADQIHSHRKSKNLRAVKAIFQRMSDQGFKPNLRIMNSLLRFWKDQQNLDEAQHCFKSFGTYGVQPDVASMNMMLELYSKYGTVYDALSFWESIKGIKKDTRLYNTMMGACKHNPSRVRALVEEMVAEGVQLNLVTFNILMEVNVRSRTPHQALEIFEIMLQADLEPDQTTYTTLMKAHFHLRQPRGVLEKLEKAKSLGFKEPTEGEFAQYIERARANQGLLE